MSLRVPRLLRSALIVAVLLVGAGMEVLVISHAVPPGSPGMYSIRSEHLHRWLPFVAAPYVFAAFGLWCVPSRRFLFRVVTISAGLVALWGTGVLILVAVEPHFGEPEAFIGTVIPSSCALLAFLGGFVGWLDSRYPRERSVSGNDQAGEAFNAAGRESTSDSPLNLAIHRAAPWLCAVALLAALSLLGALIREILS